MDGGIAAFNYHVCKELYERGHKVNVIANRSEQSEGFNLPMYKFEIRRLNGRIRPSAVEAIYKILLTIMKEKSDVIFYGHFGSTHWLSGPLAQSIFSIPYLILVHGTEFNAYLHRFTKVDSWVSKIILKNAAQIIVNSRATKKLVEDHGYPPGKIHVVHPGANPEMFKADNTSNEIKRKYKLEGKKVLLSISRLVAKKNHAGILHALPEVINRIPNLTYLIVGRGPEEEKIRRIIEELRLQDYVILVGYVEPQYTAPYYHVCDIFVMPSKTVDIDYESFGIVYAEANACGKPVIAGRSGGIEDAVFDGVTGLLVDPDNIEEISHSIVRLLTDAEYAQKLGENGRQRVEKELNWSVVGEKIEEILKIAIE